jgi:protein-tyrosine phosphatase
MSGLIDLHCHWVADIDDGPKNWQQSEQMLKGLRSLGFDYVVATPHMRPDLFDNTSQQLTDAYQTTVEHMTNSDDLPKLGLACEHFFNDVIFSRILRGEGLPYPGGHGILIELGHDQAPAMLTTPLFEVRRHKLRPVLAHPERYQAAWKHPDTLTALEDHGVVMMLDILALVGVYGRNPKKAAERWLEQGVYYAACSDAHHMRHIDKLDAAMQRLRSLVGPQEAEFLLSEGPHHILSGQVQL